LDGVAGVELRVLPTRRPVADGDLPDADVTVATWWETAEWVAALSPSKGAKVYFVQHDERQVQPGQAAAVEATWRLPMAKLLVAQWLEPVLREHGAGDDMAVVPNSVDLEQFHAPPRERGEPARVGLMYSDKAFKGVDVALEAYRLAREQMPDLELLAFGKDDPYPHLPLPDGAVYEQDPPQERLRELYAACDAWLFASRSEGFGLPILEAMACRTPVVATPAGAAPELLAGGGGRLVAMGDADRMAAAVVDLCGGAARGWRSASEAAHATATGYTWDDATARFEQTLAAAAAGRPIQPNPESDAHPRPMIPAPTIDNR
ncbi:MAG: glycosyltransferase family 4 protein, partial [Planctomycetota bacterium]